MWLKRTVSRRRCPLFLFLNDRPCYGIVFAMKQLEKLIRFLHIDIWRIPTRKLHSRHSFWITQLRTLLLALRGFDEDKCQLRASALTFYSLLSIVPIVAMAFGIAKGFGFQNGLEEVLLDKM